MCALLVGLDDVRILSVDEPAAEGPLEVVIETICDTRPTCDGCGQTAMVKDRDEVRLVDLASMGRPVRLVWRKRRWHCPNPLCGVGSWTEINHQIASPRQVMTRRAGAWATIQVGRHGRAVADVSAELGCDWHTVNDSVVAWGDALLEADVDRIGTCTAVGLDETSFVRRGRFRRTEWATTITDVAQGRLLDVIEGRTADAPTAWLAAQGQQWLDQVEWAALDLSGAYRKVFNTILPGARQVADPFHVIRLANQRVDQVRRRVQNTILGHRGRKSDPLYRCRRLLVMAEERHTPTSKSKLTSLLHLGDPFGEVRDAWIAKECVRDIYTHADPATALAWVTRLGHDLQDEAAREIRSLGRTLVRWAVPISNWHASGITNAATEGANNLIKRTKRVGFGFRSFRNYRIRILLYAGRPNWGLLTTINPAQIR